jgi:TfoX/Sxy family transcriptional regulator of competence genes
MAYDESLAQEVRRALSGVTFEEKKMFGGLGFMINGNMCAAVNNRPDHIMMVRIDPLDQESPKKKGAKVAIMRGREMPGWIFLTKEAIETEDDFEYWITRALDFNQKLPEKKK